ncbi:MAG: response regulator transcription factor [Anaerolineae bacterium]
MAERILIVEDDVPIADFIRRGLLLEDYAVEVAYEGYGGLDKALTNSPDLVILDIMLPGMNGLEVCRQLRRQSDVPVIMLTAKDAVPDRVAGLEAGADDYLVKPFAFDELVARIRALLRRHRPSTTEELRFAGLRLDPVTREVYRNDRPIDLTAKEHDLLELFMRHPRQVLTRDTIYAQVWGYDFLGESNIIEVYIRYLRSKLEAEGEPRLIQTVRGVGYTLREN